MTRARWWVVAGLVGLVLTGLGYWLSQQLIREPAYVLTGYEGEARRNWLYAAERLLVRLGREAHSVRTLAALPDPLAITDTVLLNTPGYALSAAKVEALLGWVESGGHLICTVYEDYVPGRGGDELLEALNVQVRDVGAPTEPVAIQLAEDQTWQVQFRGDRCLDDLQGNADWRVADEHGNRLLSYRWGEGRVTVLSELGLFSNNRLAEHDHADFLWQLLRLEGREGAVWLQYVPRVPSLLQLLVQHGWPMLLGLLLTLAVALWSYRERLGPVLVTREDERRRLLEHVQASGRFLWRQGEQPALLDSVRHYLEYRLERRFPVWSRLNAEQQLEYLASLSGLPREQVATAWRYDGPLDEPQFLILVQRLQAVAVACQLLGGRPRRN